jgi:competence protein ComEA
MKVKSAIALLLFVWGMLVAVPAIADGKIDINTASAAQLAEVKGIGPKLSEAIVSYRKEHGAFKNVDALLQVHGIGEKSLSHIRGNLMAGAAGKSKSKAGHDD